MWKMATDQLANRQISKHATSAHQQNSQTAKQINSQNSKQQQNSQISKQQQIFSDQLTARAVFRPEASGPGILTA